MQPQVKISFEIICIMSDTKTKKGLITTMLKFFFNNYKAHLQQHVESHSTIEDFTDMDQDTR